MIKNILWWFMEHLEYFAIGLLIGISLVSAIILQNNVTIIKQEYKKQYSYELKGITNKEYEYTKSNGYFIIAFGGYSSTNEYEEYYILWQNTERGLKKVKLENKNVYIIENSDEKPRIEYYVKYRTNKNGVSIKSTTDFYYQIYIPENAIDYSYKLN